MIFAFLLFFYYFKEKAILSFVICYNGLVKSDFIEKRERRKPWQKKISEKTLVEQILTKAKIGLYRLTNQRFRRDLTRKN